MTDRLQETACLLIVSPDETVRALIRRALSAGASAYEFYETDDLETASAVLGDVRVDLLLSDLGTLDQTLQLCKRAAQASPATLRIVILPDDEIAAHPGELGAALDTWNGFFRYVRKPWEAAGLRVSIRLALQEQRKRAPLTILGVDDDSAVVGVLRRMLEQGGHTVRVAANGREALAVLERELVDLIIAV